PGARRGAGRGGSPGANDARRHERGGGRRAAGAGKLAASAVDCMRYRVHTAGDAAVGCRPAPGLAGRAGLGMLLYQGAAAFERWTGRPPPVAVMRDALLEALAAGR